MKKLVILFFSICLLATYAQAKDPYWDGYDDAQENQGECSDNEEYLDGYEDAQRNQRNNNTNRQNTIINGEWDTQGNHYAPAGGGNKWRQDGTFMQKAAGGYIDTKTGQFVPAN